MQDESPWKPPTDGAEPDAPEQPLAPTLPAADQPSAPTLPSQPPVSQQPPTAPQLPAAPPSPWAPGGAGGMAPPPPPPSAPGPMPSIPPATPVAPGPIAEPAHLHAPVPAGPLVGATRSPERPRRSKLLVGGAVAAVLAVGGAGVFAVSNLSGSTAGGAAGPEELGAELLGAIENEDALGVIDVLLPGEREALGEPFVELVSELQRLEVLAETDLSQISGLDIELSGEEVEVRSTNVDDIVNVDLRAEIVVSIDGSDLPLGDLVTDNLPDDAITELRGSRVTQTDRLDIWLTAVQHDERWYFSMLHSIAERARGEAAPGTGIPSEGVGSDGAATPGEAVDQVLDRVEAIDLTGLIRSLNPGEAAALQRYAPLFLEDAEVLLDAVPLRWEITEREIRIAGDGDSRTAFIDALTIEGDLDGSPFTFGYGDGCVRAEIEGERIEQCTDATGLDSSAVDEIFGDQPEIVEVVETLEAAFADIEPAGIEVREYDGEWYVSPIGSFTEVFLKLLRALDRQELDDIIAAAEPAFASVEDALFDSVIDVAGGGLLVEDGDAITLDDQMEIQVDDGSASERDGDDDTIEVGADDWFECYDETDVDEATACFESYVASGEIERSTMPVVLRHPECGYAEPAWTNEIYSLPDAEFIAAAESARDCFLALVDSGEVSPYELPSEIMQLECFEGRNWYQVFDDPEYDERYYECIGTGFDE